MFLRNYIIDNQDFSSYFFWVRLIVAPCTQFSVYLHFFLKFFFVLTNHDLVQLL